MGMLTTYIALLLAISVVFWLGGYQSGLWTALANGALGNSSDTFWTLIFDAMKNVFTNPVFLTIIGLATIATYLMGGAGFTVFFTVPLFMLYAVANILFLPTSALFTNPTGNLFVTGMCIFMNVLMMLAIIEFMRGGSV